MKNAESKTFPLFCSDESPDLFDMNYFFDVLLYFTFIVTIFLFAMGLIYFPVKVANIDITKNRKNKPPEQYLENKFVILEVRIALTTALCSAVSILCLFLGSFPKEIENPGFLLFVPLAIWFIVTGSGGVFLGQYFLNTAKKSKIYQKTNHYPTIFVRNHSYYSIGVIISFFLGCTVAFTLMHFFYLLNLI